MDPATKTPSEKFKESLKTIQQEAEELMLQFSLGKAEAKDKFEEVKKDLLTSIRKWKEKPAVDKKSQQLKKLIEELELQLALGKAEAIDKFKEQKEKTLESIKRLETEFKNNPEVKELKDNLKEEFEKFKLKMEILQLKYEEKKFDFKTEFKDEMDSMRSNLNSAIGDKWNSAKSNLSDFSDEIEVAFTNLKKVVQSFGSKTK